MPRGSETGTERRGVRFWTGKGNITPSELGRRRRIGRPGDDYAKETRGVQATSLARQIRLFLETHDRRTAAHLVVCGTTIMPVDQPQPAWRPMRANTSGRLAL